MEIKTLLLGLACSLAIFAVKSGAGISCLVRRQSKLNMRLAAIGGFVAVYALIFWAAGVLGSRIDILDYLEMSRVLLKNGMILHLLLAALLLTWGVALLKKGPGTGERSHCRLLLLPCPVCFSVILFSSSFLHILLPDVQWLFGWLFAGFIIISLGSGLGLTLFGRGNAGHGLGMLMILVGLYFLLTIALVPQFGDIERIYRLSLGSVTTLADNRLPLLLIGMVLAFMSGFIITTIRLRRSSWT